MLGIFSTEFVQILNLYFISFLGLDLLRLYVLRAVNHVDESMLQLIYDAVDFDSFPKDISASATREQEINLTMGLRTIANLFNTKNGRASLITKGSSVCNA
jgi:hypothetical protein